MDGNAVNRAIEEFQVLFRLRDVVERWSEEE